MNRVAVTAVPVNGVVIVTVTFPEVDLNVGEVFAGVPVSHICPTAGVTLLEAVEPVIMPLLPAILNLNAAAVGDVTEVISNHAAMTRYPLAPDGRLTAKTVAPLPPESIDIPVL
jgi:hypothetical protein